MIADIEAGKVKCVITKDLSRLGRNYIEAGSYIEVFFPRHNVRYIAVTDGVDSVNRQEMDITYKKKGKDVCSGHYIREQELSAILLDDIRRITHFARQNELRFAEHIQKKQGKETQWEIAALQKRIDTMRKRQTELTKLFKRLYEDVCCKG